MTSYPFWVSNTDLGVFADGYSFTANPIQLIFGETLNLPCVVSLLNGSLPTGIAWTSNNYTIVLTGALTVDTSKDFEWTFRINNGTYSSDRTFKLSATKSVFDTFEWTTENSLPLGYVYSSENFEFIVAAASNPPGPIVYSIANINNLSKGISIDSTSGKISIDIAWKPSQGYEATVDYVYNQSQLYQCVISGNSSPNQGPLGTGTNIVDSPYPAWQGGIYYVINSVVYNDVGKIYVCIQPGTSSPGSGPTGEADFVPDGSAVWRYVSQSPVWDSISAASTVSWSLIVQASLLSQVIVKTFEIQLLSVPYPPVWVTPAGLLADLPTQVNYSQQLVAFDPDNLALVWSSTNLPSWLNLSNVGLLWGNTPLIPDNIDTVDYVFDILVADDVSTTTQTFVISVTNTTEELKWISQSDLGQVQSGTNSDILLVATTARPGSLLTYAFRGGMIPPNLLLDTNTGALQGFVEYHAQDKVYDFEILVTDGVDTLVSQFQLLVLANTQGQFFTLSIPLLGPTRFEFISDNNASVVDDNQLYLPNDQAWGRTQKPAVVVASGIKRTNSQDLRNRIQQHLHNFRISFLNFQIKDIEDKPYGLVNLIVRDADSMQPWQPNQDYRLGNRVSNPDLKRYVATNNGTSALSPPRGFLDQIADGTVIWNFDSVPNQSVDRPTPLPWYPYHQYQAGNTVVNSGLIFQALSSGLSSGGPGPTQPLASIQDNQIVWQYLGNTAVDHNNSYWPADIYNIRNSIINEIGWSTSWGSGASAVVNVDTVTGSVLSVSLIAAGSGFWASPLINVIGKGSGAKFESFVGIVDISVVFSDIGFSQGDSVVIDLDDNLSTAATIVVSSVDGVSRAVSFAITNPGQFTHIPSNNYTLVSNNKKLILKFTAGIIAVNVVEGGEGYDTSATFLNFQGKEYDPVSNKNIDQFDLRLVLAYANKNQLPSLTTHLSLIDNPFLGQEIPVTLIQATVEGIQWQGYTRFDQNLETFDCDSTRLIDFDPASETLQDQSLTYWDDRSSTFDRNMITTWPDYSQTYFDSNRTIYDYYSTLFDSRQPVYQSRWSASKLWFFGKPYDV